MKFIKYIFLAIIGIIALLLIATFFLEPTFDIQRSITIKAPVQKVFKNISDFKKWEYWSPWQELDTNMVMNITQDGVGVGATMSWESEVENVGIGSMKIASMVEDKSMETELTFFGEQWGVGYFELNESGENTEVIWGMKGDLGFFGRWIALGIDEMVGKDYEKGLKKLKEYTESQKDENPEMEIANVNSFDILYVEEATNFFQNKNISAIYAAAYQNIIAEMQKQGLDFAGAPLSITTFFDMETGDVKFNPAIPVNSDKGKTAGLIKAGKTYEGKVLKATHIGPYDTVDKTYTKMQEYMKANGLEENGYSWEEYIDDPEKVAPEELRTNIYYPVK